MVVYENYGKNQLGVELTRAYSDAGFYIERDGCRYGEAIDPTELHHEYRETRTKIIVPKPSIVRLKPKK